MDFTLVESKKKFHFKMQNERKCNEIKNNELKNNELKTSEVKNNDYKESKILTQQEMTEVLISKIKSNENIDIKTKEINKEKGLFYAINIRVDLSKIGFGVFYSAKLNTVSHINRIVNIKLVFSDNETLHHDMKVNIDSVIQCFREIAPDTITNIHIETFKDQIDNEHLSIVISTIKGSSLTYVYKKMMEFVSIINDKYGALSSSTYNKVSINEIADEIISNNNIENTEKNKIEDMKNKDTTKETMIQEDIKQETMIREVKKEIAKEIKEEVNLENKIETKEEMNDNKTIINNSILNVIENLEKEEKRLLLELENIRKLIKSQNSILEISQKDYKISKPIPTYVSVPIPTQAPSYAPPYTPLSVSVYTPVVDKSSFAYKVMHGDK
jgi:hypothetical protein